jgi:hypothetical protein
MVHFFPFASRRRAALGAAGLALLGCSSSSSSGAPDDAANAGGEALAEASCGPIEFPSGIKLVTKPDAPMTAQYAALHGSCTVPSCFLDLDDLDDGAGNKLSRESARGIKLSDHFTVGDFVGEETKVIVSPSLVELMEKLEHLHGSEVPITSGFRSPQHQQEICNSVCGKDECVQDGKVTCARLSRHMWGAAADMPLAFEAAARKAGFPFVFHENGGTGPHLHVDLQQCQ